jgi:hypothetical protein
MRALALHAMVQMATSAEACQALVAADGWELLLQTMLHFAAEEDVVQQGCRLVASVADTLRPTERFAPRACQLIASFLHRATTEAAAVQAVGALKTAWLACAAMASLSAVSPENAAQLTSLGACKCVRACVLTPLVPRARGQPLLTAALDVRAGAWSGS